MLTGVFKSELVETQGEKSTVLSVLPELQPLANLWKCHSLFMCIFVNLLECLRFLQNDLLIM